MHTVFLTGGTGYLGGYVCNELLARDDTRLALLVRGRDRQHAIEKLWKSWQLHMTIDAFRAALDRCFIVLGDLHSADLGISEAQLAALRDQVDSILHIAASLNRKSSKACFNTNLRGTLSVIKLARYLHDRRGLERYSHVSTVAVAGHRSHEVVEEDDGIDWARSDYDPYGRTKNFCEHMATQLLPDLPRTFFRPSIVMGDSRRAETSQFDMVRAFCVIADLPIVPIDPDCRIDIVNADYVGRAIAHIHRTPAPAHEIYHLSSGRQSRTVGEIARTLAEAEGRKARLAPRLEQGFGLVARLMNRAPRGSTIAGVGSLLKVFWPYITWDTVFANERVRAELGDDPTPFTEFCIPLYRWSTAQDFRYPHVPLPEGVA